MTEREQKWEAFLKDDLLNNNGLISNQYEEIQLLMDKPLELHSFRDRSLVDLLTFVSRYSEFYRPYQDFKSLQDFPVVNKDVLKENWEQIFVQEFKRRTDNREKYTSGSTGIPFHVTWDHRKHCRMIADIKYFAKMGSCESHERIVCLVVEKKKHYIPMERMKRDNVYTINCSYFDDTGVRDLLEETAKYNPKLIIAYSSMWDSIADYIARGKAGSCTMHLSSIMAEAEALKSRTRQILQDYFNCPIYSRYGNEECGTLAQEDGSGYGHRINTASYNFEILKMDSNEHAGDGEIGRVVITDLFNYAFPIIRYDNGDLAIKKELPDGRVYLEDIVGRKVDMLYTTDGRMVNWLRSLIFLKYCTDIKQFQLVQETYKKFTWILNTENHSYEEFIVKESKDVFGDDSEYEFKYVDKIPTLSSGKTQMTVCKIRH